MPPSLRINRLENALAESLSKNEKEQLLKLRTLRDLPKSRYATQSCITGIPSGRGRKIVYSHIEICKMVETIATEMREAGVRPQTPCAFVLHNSIEAIVFFLALQWIGAIAVPIDPTLSADDIASFMGEVGTSVLVSSYVDEDERGDDPLFLKVQHVCASKTLIHWYITRSTNRGVYLEMEGRRAGEGAAWAGGAADFKYDPDETCFRLAHGEAGRCLSVEMSHHAVCGAVREYASTYQLIPEQSTLLASPFYSIHGLMCVLASMYSGANVVVPEGMVSTPHALLKHAQEQKVDWLSADVDSVVAMYKVAKEDKSATNGLNLSFIRTFGGNIEAELLGDVSKTLAPVLEAYGTTETCGMVSANKLSNSRPATCGKAIDGCEVVIFDMKSDQFMSAGKIGRIGIHGRHVSKRYINNEYANKTCYLLTTDGGEENIYFLTGDTGSLSSDGFLTVTSHGEDRKRAAALFMEEEHEIQSQRDVASTVALQRAMEKKAQIEEQDRLRREEERRVQEEEERRVQEEKEKMERAAREEQERLLQEAEPEQATSSGEESSNSDFDSGKDDSFDSDVPDHIDVQQVRTLPGREGPIDVRNNAFDEAIMKQIMDRLDQIEGNQKRLEDDIVVGHRREMERMREVIEQMQKSNEEAVAPAPAIDMDVINSAVNKAAASAESSSRDTAAAAQAAKDAAEAATAAAAAHKANESDMAEVQDPNELQKTVAVSLTEVEQAIRLHPAVETARAFGKPDPKYGVEVFCAVNTKKGARVSEPWLKLHAQSLLPAACVPKKFFYKETLGNDEDRVALSSNEGLKRISAISGYSSTKVIKNPSWSHQQAASS